MSTAMVLVWGMPSAWAQPTFNQSINQTTIGPGNVAILRYDINNDVGDATQNLSFSHTLPAGVVIASPAKASSTCVASALSAPPGGDVISFTSERLGAGAQCSVSLSITSTVVGSHVSTSGDLLSSAGNSGNSTANLIIDDAKASVGMAFSPSVVHWGELSTLSYTFSAPNFTNGNLFTANIVETFDSLSVAEPANITTTCPGNSTITAISGSDEVQFRFGVFTTAAPTCTITLDVLTLSAGTIEHLTPEVLTTEGFSTAVIGRATASLQVAREDLHVIAEFIDDPVVPGDTTALRFTIYNFDRNQDASNISLSTELEIVLAGLSASGLPSSDICGAGSLVAGTSSILLSNGTIPAQSSCTFDVNIAVPPTAALGAYAVVTTPITGNVGATPVTGNQGSSKLFVQTAPTLTQSFQSSAVAGGEVVLDFTITNTNTDSALTNIGFTDLLSNLMTGVSTTLPNNGFCGPGALLTLQPGPLQETNLLLSGASLAAGESCSFPVTLTIPDNAANGVYKNTVTNLVGTISGQTIFGRTTESTLEVVAPPTLSKSFSPNVVVPGEIVTLAYHLRHDENATDSASEITFDEDLTAIVPGLIPMGLPLMNICGQGSQLSGTDVLHFTGGVLGPGEDCEFQVSIVVPGTTAGGAYESLTSAISAMVGGQSLTRRTASAFLNVANLLFSMEFVDDPVRPGQTVSLRFSIDNISAEDASNIVFTDSLNSVLAGLSAIGTPLSDVCGAGSQLQGTSTLIFTGGNLTSGTSCTFDVPIVVPAGATPDQYQNLTSTLSATLGAENIVIPAATAVLLVANPLLLSKAFASPRALPNESIVLSFTIANADATETANGLTFTDSLDSALSGLVATGLPAVDICGVGSQISGTGELTFSGGTVPPGQSCTFEVTVQIPNVIATGTQVNSISSELSGILDGGPVTADPAHASLYIDFLTGTVSFGNAVPGGTSIMQYTIVNASSEAVEDIRWASDLEATLTGLIATTLPAEGFCGASAVMTGSDSIAISGASLAGGASCSFAVTTTIPSNTLPGQYSNVTSAITKNGLVVGAPAISDLTVSPHVPGVSAMLMPAEIRPDEIVTLDFTIDNSANQVSVSDVAMSIDLPEGVSLAGDVSTTCSGGVLDFTSTEGAVELSNAVVDANATCAVRLSITSAIADNYLVSATLQTEAGLSPATMITLFVRPVPTFELAFGPNSVVVGESSVLTITVANSAVVPASELRLRATLPPGLSFVDGTAESTCGGIWSLDGLDFSSGMAPANGDCTISLHVLAVKAQMVSLQIELFSAAGSSGTAIAELDIQVESGGGCCSIANRPQPFPFEIFLALGFWLMQEWRRRRYE